MAEIGVRRPSAGRRVFGEGQRAFSHRLWGLWERRKLIAVGFGPKPLPQLLFGRINSPENASSK